jgi:hypothetical protein
MRDRHSHVIGRVTHPLGSIRRGTGKWSGLSSISDSFYRRVIQADPACATGILARSTARLIRGSFGLERDVAVPDYVL